MGLKVRYYMDQVVRENDDENDYSESLFQGRLADCEAYIRLTEKGYL